MMKFHALVRDHAQELAEIIVKENGKNITEALADGKFSTIPGLFCMIVALPIIFHPLQSPRETRLSSMPAPCLN
jgi:hypothetical protein